MRELIPPKVIAAIKEDITESDTGFLDEYRKRAEKMKVRYLTVDPVAIANNMEISENEIESYFKFNSERFRRPAAKEYAVLYFNPTEYAGMVSITPKMLEDYYREHIDDMKTDKLARVKYVLFRTKDYASRIYDVGVNLRKYYEDNLDQFIEPAEARIMLISLKKPCNWNKMRALENGLKQGIAFPELAKQYSDDAATAANGGDLGYIKKGTLKEPYNGIAFGLADGQVSGIVETDNGYCIVSVEEKKEAHILPFEEVSVKIEEKLLYEVAKPLAQADAKRFKIDAKKNGFEKAAMKKGATVFETDLFNSTDRIPTIGRNLLFTSTALGLGSGEVSNEIEYDEGYAVLKVIDLKPVEDLPFTDVSGKIESKIKTEDSFVYAENAAKHALNLISEGIPLKELENRMSVHVTTIEVSSTYESPSSVGELVKKSEGYYVTLLISEEPSYIPSFDRISYEVASAVAMDKADKLAKEKAEKLLTSGAITKDPSVSTAPFSRNDYVVDRAYMRPFVEQSFLLNAGQSGIVKSLGKYYVVQVIERGMDIPGYKDENAMIESQVLKEKRAEYLDDWLKKEREKAQIQINI
jgi:parvulin-like peptidyl-prolyl isomerase